MSIPVITVGEMRQWEEAAWAVGQTAEAVIARVGELIAARMRRLTHPGERVLILAGKGHNGDDARLAATYLTDREFELLEVHDPAKQLTTLNQALAGRPAWIVDGLFGIGLNRPLSPDWCGFIRRINEAEIPVLAVDAPSGLNCETGLPEGIAIRAEVTLTLGAPKTGLLAASAWPFVGRLEVEPEIGLGPRPVEGALRWTEAGDFASLPGRRMAASHKGTYGHLAVVAGSLGYHGAAVLAAQGAAAAQPGLITVFTCPETYLPVASQLRAAMVKPWTDQETIDSRTSCLVVGPGLASTSIPDRLREACRSWWLTAAFPVVADASALDWLPESKACPPGIRVVTPHPGEAARLLATDVAGIQADRPAAVRRISSLLGGACVLLKGHQTLVGTGQGPVFINGSGSPRLAQGGSGDVLAGYLGGLLAQPAWQADAMRTVRYAAWRHGLAGESAGWSGLIDDLPRAMVDQVEPAGGRLP